MAHRSKLLALDRLKGRPLLKRVLLSEVFGLPRSKSPLPSQVRRPAPEEAVRGSQSDPSTAAKEPTGG